MKLEAKLVILPYQRIELQDLLSSLASEGWKFQAPAHNGEWGIFYRESTPPAVPITELIVASAPKTEPKPFQSSNYQGKHSRK